MDLTQRILSFDAAPAIVKGLERGALQTHVRFQAYAAIRDFFDQPDPKRCTCGCGLELTGRRRRWATDECSWFGLSVLRILKCDADEIRHWLVVKCGEACAHCGVMGEKLQVDHIIPVHQGGGGRWLDNYQLLCDSCHKVKTKADRAARLPH